MKNNHIIKVSSEDNSIVIQAEFVQGNPQVNYPHVGKSFPKTTQCLLFVNGFLEGSGKVVKSHLDEDNDQIARLRATQKALKGNECLSGYKELRTKLWAQLLEEPATEA